MAHLGKLTCRRDAFLLGAPQVGQYRVNASRIVDGCRDHLSDTVILTDQV